MKILTLLTASVMVLASSVLFLSRRRLASVLHTWGRDSVEAFHAVSASESSCS